MDAQAGGAGSDLPEDDGQMLRGPGRNPAEIRASRSSSHPGRSHEFLANATSLARVPRPRLPPGAGGGGSRSTALSAPGTGGRGAGGVRRVDLRAPGDVLGGRAPDLGEDRPAGRSDAHRIRRRPTRRGPGDGAAAGGRLGGRREGPGDARPDPGRPAQLGRDRGGQARRPDVDDPGAGGRGVAGPRPDRAAGRDRPDPPGDVLPGALVRRLVRLEPVDARLGPRPLAGRGDRRGVRGGAGLDLPAGLARRPARGRRPPLVARLAPAGRRVVRRAESPLDPVSEGSLGPSGDDPAGVD